MKRNIIYILVMLLALPAAFSCESMNIGGTADYRLVITGTVSDFNTDAPLEGIKVSFSARIQGDVKGKPLYEMNVYTDNHGTYTIDTDTYPTPVTCTITASDTEGTYISSVNEVEVTWSGVSFDAFSSTFIVNDCDFKLEKK